MHHQQEAEIDLNPKSSTLTLFERGISALTLNPNPRTLNQEVS